MQMLSEDDANLRDMTREQLDAAWDLWFDLAQSTNDADPPYSHGVFAVTDSVQGPSDSSLVHGTESLAPEARICAGLLARVMSHLSEEYWCAGWLLDLEYDLWAALAGSGSLRVSKADLDQLRYLADKCGGWIAWDDLRHAPGYVTADAWRRIVQARACGHG